MKKRDLKILIGISLFVIFNVGHLIFIPTNYMWIMKENTKISKPISRIGNRGIYILNKNIIKAMKQTPKAKEKVFEHAKIYSLLTIFIIFPFLPYKKKQDFGSARWAEYDDLGYSGFLFPTPYAKAFEINLLEKKGVVLGKFNNKILHDNSKTHILLSAPTRTGKGVSIIIPTLVDTWADSVIVLDVKGENYQKTSAYRKNKFKNKILRFSPKDKNNSCKYNPLSEIRFMTDREIEDARVISNLIMQEDSGTSSDPFWATAGSDFLCGVILYVLYKKNGNAGLADVVDFITDTSDTLIKRMNRVILQKIFNPKEDKEKLERLREIYPLDKDEFINKGRHPFIARTFADTLQKGEKTLPSIIATTKAKLSVFEMPTVKHNTSKSDFRIKDLMDYKDPISLYIVIDPGDLQSLAPLIRILIIQIVTILTPELDYNSNKGFKHKLLLLLDEFPTIGKMEILEKAIGYVAGYGMKMMLVVQSLDQLNKIYTKDNAFMSNCQVQVFYTANDNQTAQYISNTIGKKTMKQTSVSKTSFFKPASVSTSYTGKELISSEEVRRLSLNNIILLVGGKPPIKAKKILYFNDKEFKNKTKYGYVKSEKID